MSLSAPPHELLFSLFAKEILSISVLTWDDVWDDEYERTAKGLVNLKIGLRPIFVIVFTDNQRDPLDRCIVIMKGMGIRAVECANTKVEIRRLAYTFLKDEGHEEDVTYCLQKLNFLVVPFDSMANYPICTKQLSLISHEGILHAVLIWFQHGFRIGFVYGYSGEICLLINEQVDAVYNQALQKQEHHKLLIDTKIFERPAHFSESEVDLIHNFEWFEDLR